MGCQGRAEEYSGAHRPTVGGDRFVPRYPGNCAAAMPPIGLPAMLRIALQAGEIERRWHQQQIPM